jgi:hypothetical protein
VQNSNTQITCFEIQIENVRKQIRRKTVRTEKEIKLKRIREENKEQETKKKKWSG